MSLPVNSRLGPYQIKAPLGWGGMGEVYRAQDSRLDRDVAIKVLHEEGATSPERRTRFEREARAIAALNHPNIVGVFDFGIEGGQQFIVSELVDGDSLRSRLSDAPFPVRRLVEIATQIADGLAAAHAAGIVHRDMKPENIMLAKDGRVKILDFGLARQVLRSPVAPRLTSAETAAGLPDNQHITAAGQVLGTPSYMSPEQAIGKDVDYRSDQFSFGLILYEMATGRQAFVRNSALETMAAIVRDDPALIEQKLPAPLLWLIDRCLHKDAQQRYDSTLDLYRDLRTIRDHLSEAYSSVTVAAVAPTGKKAGSPWQWLAIVALAMLGAALLLDRWFGRAPVPREVVSFAIYPPEKTVFSTPLNITLNVPQFALSPNGRMIVFAAGAEGERPLLWRRPIDEVAAQPMPGTEDAEDPFWSPDSRWIGFFAEGKLKKVPVSGGAAQVVVPVVRGRRGGTWGSDDTILFANSAEPIQRVAAAGGQPTVVTTLAPGESTHRYPDFLPDGRHFLYLRTGENVPPSLFTGSLDDKSKKLIAPMKNSAVYAAPGYLLFVDGDTLFGQRFDAVRLEVLGQPFLIAEHAGETATLKSAISSSAAGVIAYAGALAPNGRLTWFDRVGRALNSTGPEGYYTDFRLSPNDKSLAASLLDRKTGSIEIWINDFARGSNSRVANGDVTLSATPIWSPDGAQFMYRIFLGTVQLYQRSAAGGGSGQVVLSYQSELAAGIQSTNFLNTDWSPDGKSILCSGQNPNSGTDLWLLPLTGDRMPVKLLASPADEMHGNFSPDGRLVAYTSNESGKFQIYAQTLPFSDKKWQVSTIGGYEPRWRPDGHEIYYLSEDRKLMAVSVGPGPSFGIPKALFQTRVPAGVSANRTHYVPSHDGQRFLINTESENQSPSSITVMMGWAERKF